MQYLGGKSRIAKQLAEVIDRYRQPGQLVWDAFCGGLSMSVALSKNGPVWSTDACVPLMALHAAVQAGWEPPRFVGPDEYQAAKSLPDSDPMKAFCAVCCSFSGKWFGGYAKSGDRNYALNGHNALKKARVATFCGAVVDFLAVEPRPTAALLYLDPPYAGTTGYAGTLPFDHDRFVERVQGWAQHAHVFVSEYSFPLGECVWDRAQTTTVSRNKSRYATAIERLYHLHPGNV